MPAASLQCLPPDHVDLWWLECDPTSEGEELEVHLSAAEQAAFRRLTHPAVRRQRRAFRAHLRRILGTYLGTEGSALEFVEGEHGKPALDPQVPLAFNLSHSGNWGLLAVSGAPAVGVDLEAAPRTLEYNELAGRFFAAAESASLQEFDPGARYGAFMRGWVRKEAWIKALGTGLATPLDAFVVSLDDPVPDSWMIDAGATGDARDWSFLCPAPLPLEGAVAALAVRHPAARWHWRHPDGRNAPRKPSAAP